LRILTAFGLAAAAVTTFAQVDPTRTVLVVNGEQIKANEYYRRMEYLPDVGRVLQTGNVAAYPPGFLTIVQLIDEHLVLQMAQKKGLMPTDQEVQDAIKDTEAGDPKFLENWLNSGQTQDELFGDIRLRIAQFKLQTAGVTVSDQEVANFYHTERIPNLTTTPRKAKLRIIAVQDTAAENSVDADLAAGKSFAEIAKARSDDVSKANGGEMEVPIDVMPRPVIAAIDSTKIGQRTNWVDVTDDRGVNVIAHVKYLIEDKSPEKPIPFDENLKKVLRHKMMLDRGNAKNNSLFQDLSEMRKSSSIDIKEKGFATMYEHFLRQYFHETVNASGGKSGG